MHLQVDGADQAAAQVAKVREAIDLLAEPARRAAAQVRLMAEAFDAIGTRARAASDAAMAAVERMSGGITATTGTIKSELGTTFAPLGKSAETSATTATTAISGISAEVMTTVEKIKAVAADAFAPITASMATATEAVTAGFTKINESLATTIAQARAAAAEFKAFQVPAATTIPAGSGNAGLRAAARRGGAHGPHYRANGVAVPGGHVGLEGGPLMAGAAVGGYAIWEAAQAQDESIRTALTSPADAATMGLTAEDYQRRLMAGSSRTGASLGDVAEAYRTATRATQGVSPEERLKLIDALLPKAQAEAKLKGASLSESLESLIGLSHMTGKYNVEDVKSMANKFSVASLGVNASLPELSKTLGYSLPTLHVGLGIDEDTIMALTSALYGAGIKSTRSGTWVRSFYQGALANGSKKHDDALDALGIGDRKSWEVMGADGSKDWHASTDKIATVLRERMAGMSEEEKAKNLKDAFGERGSSVASLLSQKTTQDQFDGLHGKITNGAELDLFTKYSETSTLQQSLQAWRDLQNLLIDLGNTALPAVNQGIRDLDSLVKSIADAMNGKGWGNLGKQLWDRAIKPDLGPLGRLDTSPPKDSDRQPPVDMRDPRRGDADQTDPGLFHRESYRDDDGTRDLGASLAGMAPALRLWQVTYEAVRDTRQAITGPAMAAWQAARADLDGILAAVQALGEGIAAVIKAGGLSGAGAAAQGGDGSSVGGGIVPTSYESPSASAASSYTAQTDIAGRARAAGGSVRGHIDGQLAVGGETFRFGSGGAHGAASIPAGTYPITPGAIGSWGRAHHAIGLAGGRMWDATLGRMRTGIELHAGRSMSLITHGCLAFLKQDFPKLKARIAAVIREHGRAYLHVGPHGATIDGSPRRAAEVTAAAQPRPVDAAALAGQGLNGSKRGGKVYQHTGDVHITVPGAGDADAVAHKVMRTLTQARQYRTNDVDWDT